MAVCPAGHESAATDFCDTCGIRIDGAAPTVTPTQSAGPPAGASNLAAPAEPCPQCGTGRSGQFCEGCGYDYAKGAPAISPAMGTVTAEPEPTMVPSGAGAPGPAGAGQAWSAVVTADRAYFDSVIAAGGPDAASIQFPAYCPERRFQLTGSEMRIGRRSAARGLEPEIDLTGPPADPGVSHLHAVLVGQPDGTWSVLDPGSSNGTQVNGDDIEVGVQVPLHDGDCVFLGAWTKLTIQAG